MLGHRESDREWWDFASCAGSPSYWWDTDVGQHESTLTLDNVRGIVMCVQCPVRNQCLTDAIKHAPEYTIRAGYTPRQQRDLIKQGLADSRAIPIVEKMLTLTKDNEIVARKAHEVISNSARRVQGKWVIT